MTNLLTDDDIQRFRSMKEDVAQRAAERGTDDMNGLLEVWRDGAPVLAIFTPDVDRDQLLDAAWMTVPALKADRIVAVMDAHLTNQMENPATGKPWEPGEMQKACHEDGACSTGVITDCLIINEVSRDGSYRMLTLPYHIDEAAKAAGDQAVAVHWQEQGDKDQVMDGENLQGLIPDVLRGAFERDTGLLSPPDDLEFTEAEDLAARDAACIARLAQDGYGVALMVTDEEHGKLVGKMLNSFVGDAIAMTSPDDMEDA